MRFPWMTQLNDFWFGSRRSRTRRRHARYDYSATAAEVLLCRQLLSNIAITAVAGNLTATGDNGDHKFVIQTNGANIEFAGQNGTQFTFHGTTAAVQDVPLATLGNSFGVSVNLGSGMDNMKYTGSLSSAINWLNINMGEGLNTLNVAQTKVLGGVSITGGNGGNNLTLLELNIGGLTVTTGSGADNILLGEVGVLGSLFINSDAGNAAGADHIEMEYSGVFGATTILTGGGNDQVTIGPEAQFIGPVSVISNATSGTGLNLELSADGQADVELDSSLTVIGGAANDRVSLSATNGAKITVNGPITVNLGDGSNILGVMANSSVGQVVGLGGLRFIGGSGSDVFDSGVGVTLPSLSISAGGGQNIIGVEHETINGPLVIATGSSNDTVDIGDTVVKGPCQVTTGDGSDELMIRDSHLVGITSLVGGTGAGDSIAITGSVFDQALNVTMLGSHAQLFIDTIPQATSDTVFNGPVTAVMPGPNDAVNIGYIPPVGHKAIFNNSILFIGGASPLAVNVHQQASSYTPSKLTLVGATLQLLP